MENTQICEQIIKDLNGKKIQGKIFSLKVTNMSTKKSQQEKAILANSLLKEWM